MSQTDEVIRLCYEVIRLCRILEYFKVSHEYLRGIASVLQAVGRVRPANR
jgi:hypothetical protein